MNSRFGDLITVIQHLQQIIFHLLSKRLKKNSNLGVSFIVSLQYLPHYLLLSCYDTFAVRHSSLRVEH